MNGRMDECRPRKPRGSEHPWQDAQHPEKLTRMKPEKKNRGSYLEGLRWWGQLSRLGDESMCADSYEVIHTGEGMEDGERS